MTGPVLDLPRLQRRPGRQAIRRPCGPSTGVDFEVRAGEIHCLCGENGAGKSTLIKILSGVHPHGSYGGAVQVDGHEVRFRGPRDAARAGIGVIHQELAWLRSMSVAENLFLGELP